LAQLVEALLYKPEGRGGSIPDDVFGIFHCHKPSGCTMVLGLTQPLKEMNTRRISCEEGGGGVGSSDKLTTFMCRLSLTLRLPD